MDRIVLITGATGGLGSIVSKAFLAAGDTVVGTARSIRPTLRGPDLPRSIPVYGRQA